MMFKEIKPRRRGQAGIALMYVFLFMAAVYFFCHKWILAIVNWAR